MRTRLGKEAQEFKAAEARAARIKAAEESGTAPANGGERSANNPNVIRKKKKKK